MKKINVRHDLGNRLYGGQGQHKIEGAHLHHVGFAIYIYYSTNHVYLHRPNAFGFWQMRLHLCYVTLKRISNFSELA